eukprot:TRINITY_DN13316_c0_g1_i1.p1 TRINITY_DN13316_c0_g1~~TRINITY_DN13316_c0_g1_i1.p1  ORF type:complete len:520 (-),score=13.91 TRINITY_DN13316_c0_g1_i1:12-1571(-)
MQDPLTNQARIKSFRFTKMRWVALGLACTNLFGNYYAYDNPQSLQDALQTKLELSDFQYNLLYSVYSFPNMILPLIGGHIVDWLGVRTGVVVFSTILLAAQVLIAFGGFIESFGLMLVGRTLYGIGGESLTVAQCAIIANWFIGKELAFAFGLNLSLSRAGSSFNSWLTPKTYSWTGSLGWSLSVSVIVLAVGLLSGSGFCIIDRKKDQQEGKEVGARIDDSEKVMLSSIKEFGRLFWFLVAICLMIYSSFFPFLNIANKFLSVRFGFTPNDAGDLLLIPYLTSALATPFLGIVVDKFGQRPFIMLGSYLLLFAGHGMFAFFENSSTGDYRVVVPLACLGVFYSFFAAVIWPCVALVVDPKKQGTAYGLMTAIQNSGLALAPMLVGWLHDRTDGDEKFGYFWVSIFLLYMAFLGLVFTLGIAILDKRQGSPLARVYATSDEDSDSLNLTGQNAYVTLIIVSTLENVHALIEKVRIFISSVSYTHLRAHETRHDLVCRLLLEKKKCSGYVGMGRGWSGTQ